jgi:hypothetical protein
VAFGGRSFKQRPMLPFFPDDWRGSPRVQAMAHEQRSWYFTLLLAQWDDPRGSVPAAVAELAALVGVSPEQFAAAGGIVERCFRRTKGGRLRNAKLAQIRTAADAWYARQRANAGAANGKSDRKVLTGQELDTTHLTLPCLTKKTARAGRAHLASARESYLAACPHEPPCTTPRVCGDRRALDEALAAGRIDAAQAHRLLRAWGVEA